MRLQLAAAAAALSLAGAAPAAAATTTVYFDGAAFASAAGNTLGVFGNPGAPIDGLPFQAAVEIDYDAPGAVTAMRGDITRLLIGNGASSPVHISLTINGNTVQPGFTQGLIFRSVFDPNFSLSSACTGVAGVASYCQTSPDAHFVLQATIRNFEDLGQGAFTEDFGEVRFFGAPPPGLDLVVPEGMGFEGSFFFSRTQDRGDGPEIVTTTQGFLRVDSVRFAAVPEPGAWVLMILGFGVAGAAIRRRRIDLAPG